MFYRARPAGRQTRPKIEMNGKGGSDDADLVRRRVLQALGGALGTVAVGCGLEGSEATGAASSTSTGEGGRTSSSSTGGRHHGAGGSGGDGQGGKGGAGGSPDPCVDTGNLTPAELLSHIEHVIVLCMENRSFDHYLGSRKLVEHRDVDGLSGSESNPDPDGVPVPIFNLDTFTVPDPPHDWDPVHQQWDNGLNDGFVKAFAGPDQSDVMGYYVRAQLPVTYALADAFTVCDRYFSALLGPTWPNRFYLHGGTSQGNMGNTPLTGFKSVFDYLGDAGVASANYYGDIAWAAGAYFKVSDLHTIDTLMDDLQSGSIPPFTLIDPAFFGSSATDDHPDHDVQLGQAFIATIATAIGQSPIWEKCLFVITYDEHGGFFDHVPPPPTYDDDAEFAQLGFRVPTLVMGPFARQGCVSSTRFEHCSILRTLQVRFGVTSVNARVDSANDLSSCLDPAFFTNPQPMPPLPQVEVSMARLRASRSTHAGQPELRAIAERGLIPPDLDHRADAMDICERWLRRGAELGAIKLV